MAAPPMAILWHNAKKLPASTRPMIDCHAAAAEPATGPTAENPTAPRIGTMAIDAIVTAPPRACKPNR
ncbi:hypothetical protein H4I96_12086 [Botrytis cinerea]